MRALDPTWLGSPAESGGKDPGPVGRVNVARLALGGTVHCVTDVSLAIMYFAVEL